ncbi:hypothetical protein KIH27_10060, partial [Mycobacterium sp. M1]|nr:hypothetical protein [Mycolicibacter acidiphilus]
APAPAPPAPPAPALPTTPPPPPPTPAGPAVMPVQMLAYLVGGMGAQARRSAGTGARRRKAAEADRAAAPGEAAAAEEQARRQRRRRAKAGMLGRGYEYMDLEPDPVSASARGGGPFGFADTVPRADAGAPAGLTALAGDAFGGVATMPMVPGSWDGECGAGPDGMR